MSTRKALAYSFLDRYAGLILAIVSSMILSRLLSPAEIGVFSVTMVLLSFVATIRDLGAGQYLVQVKELTTERIRAVWAVQLGLGTLLAMLILAGSSSVASFYKEPRMQDIMLILAANYVVTPFGSLTVAWLSREMRFDAIAIIRFASTLAGSLVSVGLAWAGHGPISLAWGALANTLVTAGIAVFYRPRNFPWLPGVKGLRHVFSFGSTLTGISIVNTANQATPELFLGRLQGMAETGLYSRGQGLAAMFQRLVMDATVSVSMPYFSKQYREGQRLDAPFIQMMSLVTVLGWSFLGSLAILTYPVMRILYGTQWDDSVDLTRILCLSVSLMLPSMICSQPMVAVGAVRKAFRIHFVHLVAQAAGAAIGAGLGLNALGWSLAAASLLMSAIWLRSVQTVVPFAWADLRAAVGKSLLVACATMAAPLAAMLYTGFRPDNIVIPVAIATPLGALGFLLAARACKHPIWHEIERLLTQAGAALAQRRSR